MYAHLGGWSVERGGRGPARASRPAACRLISPLPTPLPPPLQLLDELQVLTNQAQDLDVALIDKKIDQVRCRAV